MEFFNDNKLAFRLKQDEVSEKEKLYYLLVFLIVHPLIHVFLITISINKEIIESSVANINQWTAASMLISTILTLMGTYYCFQQNQKNDDKNFLERFICLSFPIGIQSIGIGLIAFFINTLLLNIFYATDIPSSDTILTPIQSIIVSFYFYIRLFRKISFLSSPHE